jgi:hypothetical protein
MFYRGRQTEVYKIRHAHLTLSLLMLHICGVSKTFGEWYQKTNKTEDTNKLTLLALRRQSKNVWQLFCDRFLKRPLLTVSRSFMNVANRVLWRMAIILKANEVKLFVSSVLFVFWYHSPNVLDTPHICSISRLRVKWQTRPCSRRHVTENGSCRDDENSTLPNGSTDTIPYTKLVSDVFRNKSHDLSIQQLRVTDSRRAFTSQRTWFIQRKDTTVQTASLAEMSTPKETFLFCLTLLCVR